MTQASSLTLQWRHAVKDALGGLRVPGDLRVSLVFLCFSIVFLGF